MKKKALIIGGVVITIFLVVVLVIILSKPKYKIKVSIIEDRSPERRLTVYDNHNNEVEVSRIEYLDGKLLCSGHNTVVYFGDIENEKELQIVLKDRSVAKAQIIKGEVE